MSRVCFLFGLMLAFQLTPASLDASTPPNVLMIIGDDCTFSDLSIHGGTNVQTPNIDRLAADGLQFTHAYVSMAICLPCRTELYTGLYPHRSGATWNHAAARPGTKSICHYLGDLGYRVALTGKYHVVPRASFPFKKISGFEQGCVKRTAEHDVAAIQEFMAESNADSFCLVVGLVTPHAPWTVGDPTHFDPQKLKLPPYMADTEQTRLDYARYLAEVEVMDRQVGDVLTALGQSGKADHTLVLFTSEQGAQFPGCKWTNWEQGVHTALVARWPNHVKPGGKTDALVQYADVLPTLIEIAGGDVESLDLDGSSFLDVLSGERADHRPYAFAMHNNVPEGPPYPIRSVRDPEFHYIRNLNSEATYIERHVMGRSEHNPYWSTWMYNAPVNPHAYAMIQRFMHRPQEELYRTGEDPFEMNNLATDPEYADVRQRLSAELDRWIAEQGDPGMKLDTREAWNQRRQAAGLKPKND